MAPRTIGAPRNLVAVDIRSFRDSVRDIGFDVYLKLGEENVAHVFSRASGLDYQRLAQYIQKGVTELYIHPDDEPAYRALVARSAQNVFADPATPPERRIAMLLNMTEQNMAEIFSQLALDDETARKTQAVIRNYVELMISSPQTLATILKLVSHGQYLYYHSIAVSVFSMFIAKASGQFNQKMLEIVGLGGFLHDIGCTQMPSEVVCSPTELTPPQWKIMHAHPAGGLGMIERTAHIPDEVRYIVYQHHEEPSGRGYPNGLNSSVIYYPAKIVALADAFSALISRRPFRPAYTPEQAIGVMREKAGKFDRDLLDVTAAVFLRTLHGGKKAA